MKLHPRETRSYNNTLGQYFKISSLQLINRVVFGNKKGILIYSFSYFSTYLFGKVKTLVIIIVTIWFKVESTF